MDTRTKADLMLKIYDVREFSEVIRLDEFTRIVRVGHWWHMMDRETGEGRWEWHGPEKAREFAEPEKFSKRLL